MSMCTNSYNADFIRLITCLLPFLVLFPFFVETAEVLPFHVSSEGIHDFFLVRKFGGEKFEVFRCSRVLVDDLDGGNEGIFESSILGSQPFFLVSGVGQQVANPIPEQSPCDCKASCKQNKFILSEAHILALFDGCLGGLLVYSVGF